jgi:hypothetical protein
MPQASGVLPVPGGLAECCPTGRIDVAAKVGRIKLPLTGGRSHSLQHTLSPSYKHLPTTTIMSEDIFVGAYIMERLVQLGVTVRRLSAVTLLMS